MAARRCSLATLCMPLPVHGLHLPLSSPASSRVFELPALWPAPCARQTPWHLISRYLRRRFTIERNWLTHLLLSGGDRHIPPRLAWPTLHYLAAAPR